MQARGPLMIEHRLIERMLDVIGYTLNHAEQTGIIDPYFVDTAVDFIRVYADRTHHGKEEDILFRDLRTKHLSEADRRMMDRLIQEHVFSRDTTSALIEANMHYRRNVGEAFGKVVAPLKALVNFYPEHIKKEDEVFFPAARKYFSDQEEQAILAEFWEFDRKMIHEKYKTVVEECRTK